MTPDKTPEQMALRPRRARAARWRLAIAVILVAAIAALVYVLGGRDGGAQAPAKPGAANPAARAFPVVAIPARSGELPIYLNGLGSVVPALTVAVKSRVDGQLMEVAFHEGQEVRAGDLLAQVDPRPFQVQLAQAQGQLARDQALLRNAQLDVQRYRTLVEEDSISRQQLDTQEALVRQYEAALKVDQSQVDNARLQLTYSRITAPIAGRLGLRLVDPGNIVHATDTTGIVTITQLHPIAVVFTLPEDSLPEVLKRIRAKQALAVDAYDREQRNKLATGNLLTVDNQIDPTTGTVRIKAMFDNQEGTLFPNQFVNVKLELEVKRDATLVPTTALQRAAQGAYVYMVKPDQTVTMRPVKIATVQGDLAAVDGGVKAGDLVVVDGADKLREGAKVDVQSADNGKGQGGSQRRGTGDFAGGRSDHASPERPDSERAGANRPGSEAARSGTPSAAHSAGERASSDAAIPPPDAGRSSPPGAAAPAGSPGHAPESSSGARLPPAQ